MNAKWGLGWFCFQPLKPSFKRRFWSYQNIECYRVIIVASALWNHQEPSGTIKHDLEKPFCFALIFMNIIKNISNSYDSLHAEQALPSPTFPATSLGGGHFSFISTSGNGFPQVGCKVTSLGRGRTQAGSGMCRILPQCYSNSLSSM